MSSNFVKSTSDRKYKSTSLPLDSTNLKATNGVPSFFFKFFLITLIIFLLSTTASTTSSFFLTSVFHFGVFSPFLLIIFYYCISPYDAICLISTTLISTIFLSSVQVFGILFDNIESVSDIMTIPDITYQRLKLWRLFNESSESQQMLVYARFFSSCFVISFETV